MVRPFNRLVFFGLVSLGFSACGKWTPPPPALEMSKVSHPAGDSGGVTQLVSSPDGSRLLGTTSEGKMIVWNSQTLQELQQIESGPDHPLTLAWTEDNQWLATTEKENITWDARRVSNKRREKSESAIKVAAMARSGRSSLEIRENVPGMVLWDATGKERTVYPPQGQEPFAAAFSPCGKYVALALKTSQGNKLSLFDTEHFQKKHDFPIESGGIRKLIYSQGGTILATIGETNRVDLWDSQSGILRGVVKAAYENVETVVFSGDTQKVAVSSTTAPEEKSTGMFRLFGQTSGSVVQVFDVHSGTELGRGPIQKSPITELLFTADGTGLIAAAADGALSLWRMAQPSA